MAEASFMSSDKWQNENSKKINIKASIKVLRALWYTSKIVRIERVNQWISNFVLKTFIKPKKNLNINIENFNSADDLFFSVSKSFQKPKPNARKRFEDKYERKKNNTLSAKMISINNNLLSLSI